jgi:hypothetical protein
MAVPKTSGLAFTDGCYGAANTIAAEIAAKLGSRRTQTWTRHNDAQYIECTYPG